MPDTKGMRFPIVVIGVRHSGVEVKARGDGFVVFANPRGEVGQEWFYFAQTGLKGIFDWKGPIFIHKIGS